MKDQAADEDQAEDQSAELAGALGHFFVEMGAFCRGLMDGVLRGHCGCRHENS